MGDKTKIIDRAAAVFDALNFVVDPDSARAALTVTPFPSGHGKESS